MAVSKWKVVGLVFASLAVLAIGAFVFASWRASQFQRVEVLETLKGQIIELEAIQQPVSYTHLDVYKRQVYGWAGKNCLIRGRIWPAR